MMRMMRGRMLIIIIWGPITISCVRGRTWKVAGWQRSSGSSGAAAFNQSID